ncbi:hypothetical protein VNO77_06057 [Canavalia gladiata]|uniref:Uncharacterized protein n=1 Tax=Canavalia gladiata TaxID=3824 RepID=A0AAN9N061_CANGL
MVGRSLDASGQRLGAAVWSKAIKIKKEKDPKHVRLGYSDFESSISSHRHSLRSAISFSGLFSNLIPF